MASRSVAPDCLASPASPLHLRPRKAPPPAQGILISTHTSPQFRALSLGAGVQSSTLLALSTEELLPKVDYAIFADTGWEPKSVYRHLDRLEQEIAAPAGIPVLRVSSGHIRNDALNPDHRFASMPLYVLNKDGRPGMTRRQCTGEYKVKPIKKAIRKLLGYPYPARVPKGTFVEQWIGISTDEFHRAKDADVQYMRNIHPLIEMNWSRSDCVNYLTSLGLADTPKSSCLGCPFHGNAQWRHIRDTSPAEWEDVVEFDAAIRKGNARANAKLEDVVVNGCSPWACRSEVEAVQDTFGLTA